MVRKPARILRSNRQLNESTSVKVFNIIASCVFLFAFAGYNSTEWFFGQNDKSEKLEFGFYVTRLGLSWFLAFMCWCPDLTIDVHQCPEGRLFIPSESSSKLVRGLHRFRYLWSYTWPKSLIAKIQLILCFAIMISARVCNVLVPYYSKLVVDKLTESPLPEFPEVGRLVGILIMLQMMFSTNGLLQNIHRNILYVTVQQETVRQVQVMTFNHLLHLKYEWHVKRKTGEVLRSNDRGANSGSVLILFLSIHS